MDWIWNAVEMKDRLLNSYTKYDTFFNKILLVFLFCVPDEVTGRLLGFYFWSGFSWVRIFYYREFIYSTFYWRSFIICRLVYVIAKFSSSLFMSWDIFTNLKMFAFYFSISAYRFIHYSLDVGMGDTSYFSR